MQIVKLKRLLLKSGKQNEKNVTECVKRPTNNQKLKHTLIKTQKKMLLN